MLQVHAYPILDDRQRVVQVIEYALDVTARKQAEERLGRLATIVEQAGEGIAVADLDGTLTFETEKGTGATFVIRLPIGPNAGC